MDANNRRNFFKFAFSLGAGALLLLRSSSTEAAHTSPGTGKDPSTYSAYPQKADGVSESIKNTTTLIVHKGQGLELNEVGAFLWHHIDGSKSLHHLAQLVSDSYQINFTDSYRDSESFVTALVNQSFLTLPRTGPCFAFPG